MSTSRRLDRILHYAWVIGILTLSACGGSGSDDSPLIPNAGGNPGSEVSANTITETGYITVTDGTRLRYHMQRLEEAPPGPVVMQYDGYDAGTGSYFSNIPEAKERLMQLGYSILGVSVRGTGCSSGGFNLFDPQRAVDGAEAVEWAATQPWSNGDVGMMGYSYPGVMQLFTAGQAPPSLKAIAPSNVIFDLYRDVGAPGGIFNGAFTLLFTAQQQAPGALGVPEAIAQADRECIANYISNRLAYQSFIAEGINSPHIDGDFGWADRSPATTAGNINVPVLNITYWQDEQTGSRIGGLLEPGGLLSVLNPDTTWAVLSNGNHDLTWSQPQHIDMLVQFFEYHLRGVNNGWQNTPHIQIFHELDATELQPSWVTSSDTLPEPQPATLYLREGGLLANEAPTTAEAGDSYVYPMLSTATNPLPDAADILHQLWSIPTLDIGHVVYTTPALAHDLQLLGSASIDLWLSSTADDTDIQATITEVRPNGQEVYVARGWLRASKRALIESRSTATRPFQDHSEAAVEMLTPDEPTFMRLEIFPFAHRFRAGSALRLIIDGPVTTTGDWGAFLNPTPSMNTVLHDADHPTRLVIGVMEDKHPRPEAVACGELANQPCRKSIAEVPGGRILIGP